MSFADAFAIIRDSGLFDEKYYRETYGASGAYDILLDHFLREGAEQGFDPNPFFDTAWYRLSNPDVAESDMPPLIHYILHGDAEGRAPNPRFDPASYRRSTSLAAGQLALAHFLDTMTMKATPRQEQLEIPAWSPVRSLSPDRSPVVEGIYWDVAEARSIIARERFLDRRWYQSRYEVSFETDEEALTHFVEVGLGKGWNPNPLFDADYYRGRYLEAQESASPFIHYMFEGMAQDLSPHPLVDAHWVRGQLNEMGQTGGVLSSLLHKCAALRLDPHPCFSVAFYLDRNPEIRTRRVHPIIHYLNNGWREHRLPHPLFWPRWFSSMAKGRFSDNPLLAYIARPDLFDIPPNPYFDEPWVSEAGEQGPWAKSPLQVYVEGWKIEGRSPNRALDVLYARETYRLQLGHFKLDPLSFLLSRDNGFLFGNRDGRPLSTLGAYNRSQCELRPGGPASLATKPRRHLVLLSHNLRIQGAQTSLYELARGLAAEPTNRVTILAPDDGPMKERYRLAGIKVEKYLLPVNGLEDEKQYQKLLERFETQIRDLAPDILQGNTIQAYHAIALAGRAGIPAVWNIRESEEPAVHFEPLKGSARDLLREAIESPVHYAFVSDTTRALWQATYPGIRATTINNGIDYRNFSNHMRDFGRTQTRLRLGVRQDEILIFNVGTWTERKGQRDLVEAVQLLDRRLWPRIRVLMIGRNEGNYSKEIEARYHAMPRALRERFILRDESKQAWQRAAVLGAYQAADIFAFTSRIESYPRVINEALYFGLPIVSTPCFGVIEQVEDGVSGIFYQAGDHAEMARSLASLIRSKDRRNGLKQGALHAAHHRVLQYSAMLAKYGALYDQIAPTEKTRRDLE